MKAGLQFDSRQMSASGGFVEYSVPISVAQNEVVKLHAIHGSFQMGGVDYSMRAYFNLKTVKDDGNTAPESENDLMEDKHTFWRMGYKAIMTASGVFRYTHSETIYFSIPLVLIRQPRVCFTGGGALASYLNTFWYYTKDKVTDSDLTKFMVKRHS